MKAGIDLMFATDRCHQLDDPWRDAAVPVRFHEEDASLDAVMEASIGRPIDGVIAVGDRPVVLAARVAQEFGLPGNPRRPPRPAATSSTPSGVARRWPPGAVVRRSAPSDSRRDSARCTLSGRASSHWRLSGSRGVMRANDAGRVRCAPSSVSAHCCRARCRVRARRRARVVLVEGVHRRVASLRSKAC